MGNHFRPGSILYRISMEYGNTILQREVMRSGILRCCKYLPSERGIFLGHSKNSVEGEMLASRCQFFRAPGRLKCQLNVIRSHDWLSGSKPMQKSSHVGSGFLLYFPGLFFLLFFFSSFVKAIAGCLAQLKLTVITPAAFRNRCARDCPVAGRLKSGMGPVVLAGKFRKFQGRQSYGRCQDG